jgi:hypothetical protein
LISSISSDNVKADRPFLFDFTNIHLDSQRTTKHAPQALETELQTLLSKEEQRQKALKSLFSLCAKALDTELLKAPTLIESESASLCNALKATIKSQFALLISGEIPLTTSQPLPDQHTGLNAQTRPLTNRPSYAAALANPAEPANPAHSTKQSTLTPTAQAPPMQKRKLRENKDTRLFIRLSANNKWKTQKAYDILVFLKAQLPARITQAIKRIDTVPSGFALVPLMPEDSKLLLDHSASFQALLNADKVEAGDKWIRAIIPRVPTTRWDFIENKAEKILDQELASEIAIHTGQTPIKAYFSKFNEDGSHTGTVTAWFKLEAASRIPRKAVLIGAEVFIRLSPPKEKPVLQCNKCGGFHNPRTCTRPRRCFICGTKDHLTKDHKAPCDSPDCDCPPKCPNCNGPHKADSPTCLARPVLKDGVIQRKTKTQLLVIREAENMAWLEAKRLGHLGNASSSPNNLSSPNQVSPIQSSLHRDLDNAMEC